LQSEMHKTTCRPITLKGLINKKIRMDTISEINLDELTSDLRKAVRGSTSREDITKSVAQVFTSIVSKIGVPMDTGDYLMVSNVRAHSLVKKVIIACELPDSADPEKVKNDLIEHIIAEAEDTTRFFGIIISDTITVVRVNPDSGEQIVRGPHDISRQTVSKVIMILRGLTRKELSAEELLKDVGPDSKTASTVINALYNNLCSTENPETLLIFHEWARGFSQRAGEGLKGLDGLYYPADRYKLLFCIHTYVALLMKMVAAELASLYGPHRYVRSYLTELERASSSPEKVKTIMKDVEEGVFFKNVLHITNFSGSDHFSWYVEEMDTSLVRALAAVARTLSDYEYATPALIPEKAADIFKIIYQAMVPASVRHNLGEYYTPDWLATFLLDRAGFTVDSFERMGTHHLTAPFSLRLLDPACGSGTFLVEALKRLRHYAEEHDLTDILVEHVLKNVIGIDCSPLAVLAAKTNYLLVLGDILCYTDQELPVYCADSLTEFLYSTLFLEKVDYIIGNPPWVVWDNLPTDYRKKTYHLWKEYGLFTLTGSQARYGGGKKDISMLFTYMCIDKYLKDAGTFGFLITQSVFKTKGAGEGFRQFSVKGTPLKVIEVHDFVKVDPFESAHNRTAALIVKKGAKTVYPVSYTVWEGHHGTCAGEPGNLHPTEMVAIPSDPTHELSPWITVPGPAVLLVKKVCGKNRYPVYEGINSGGANGVYCINILGAKKSETKDIHHYRNPENVPTRIHVTELLVENVTKGTKKNIKKVKTVIEDFFLYPLVKSRHLKKWKITGYTYMLQMQDPVKRIGMNEPWVKTVFPKTYAYLKEFENILLDRVLYRKFMGSRKAPFYTMYNVGQYTYALYKVVWNRMGSHIHACVLSTVCDRHIGEKCVLPDNVLAFIPTDSRDEAHYVCSIMNSRVVGVVLSSLAGGTKSFATPRIVEDTIKIPAYDPGNELHRRLSDFSQKAHSTASIKRITNIEKEIDSSVAELFGISEGELHLFDTIQ
jgi:hypothetical protein